jgi:hypothetical protein
LRQKEGEGPGAAKPTRPFATDAHDFAQAHVGAQAR